MNKEHHIQVLVGHNPKHTYIWKTGVEILIQDRSFGVTDVSLFQIRSSWYERSKEFSVYKLNQCLFESYLLMSGRQKLYKWWTRISFIYHSKWNITGASGSVTDVSLFQIRSSWYERSKEFSVYKLNQCLFESYLLMSGRQKLYKWWTRISFIYHSKWNITGASGSLTISVS